MENIRYTEDEHAVWRTVRDALAPLHSAHACDAYLAAKSRFTMGDRVPQLAKLNERLGNWSFAPVAGLVPARTFLSSLAKRTFLSTQYIRPASTPLYTPEPDIVHEVIGHAIWFLDPTMCVLQERFGKIALHASDDEMRALDRLYWFTIEFGVTFERGELKAFGAGILSSAGELARFRRARILPFDPERIAQTPYDPTTYQDTLFAFDSAELVRHLDHRAAKALRFEEPLRGLVLRGGAEQ